ncbi:MAG: hypothetical protein ACI4KF_00965 [Huintestinicola sp.]
MKEVLLCKSVCKSGKVIFVVYDGDAKAIRNYSFEEISEKILSKLIENAKLENSVVKLTDSKRAAVKLTYEENQTSQVYYILSEYTSEFGLSMFCAVSNTGELFEFSENVALSFLADKKLVNGYITKKGLHVINVPTFTTALHK